jgi:hypothetical protein
VSSDPAGPPGAPRWWNRPRAWWPPTRTSMTASRPRTEPVIVIVIGLALGLVDQTSSEVSGMLRIPALIAALILVGHGLNMLEDISNARKYEEAAAAAERRPVSVGAPEPATQPQVVIPGSGEETVEQTRTPTRAYLVVALAIWLGIATLAYPTAPLALILLSLLSAYLLFAKGWRMMQNSVED